MAPVLKGAITTSAVISGDTAASPSLVKAAAGGGGRGMRVVRTQAELEDALAARGQIVGIRAEAGMGKSRLVAEGVRLARHDGFIGYSQCKMRKPVEFPGLFAVKKFGDIKAFYLTGKTGFEFRSIK